MASRRGRDRIRLVAVCAVLAVLCSAACVQRVNINGHSMEPALPDGSWAIVDRAVSRINRGDIVAFKWPRDESKNFLQRIVGLPGERIEMTGGRVAIDGRPLEEPYVAEANRSRDTWGPRLIPAGEYFTMGDNRGNSSDSRTWGTVKRELIWARLMVR
jgi:signal peptidase I